MTPLNFQPDAQGVLRASARGFDFMIEESPVGGKAHSTLYIDVSGTSGSDRIFSRGFFGIAMHKEMAQSFADAIERAVAEEAKGLRALLGQARGVIEGAIQYGDELQDSEDVDYLVGLASKIDADLADIADAALAQQPEKI